MQIPYFDAHCDTLFALTQSVEEKDLFRNSLHIDLERGSAYCPRAQIFAIFADDGSAYDEQFSAQYAIFKEQTEKYSDIVSFCRSAADIKAAVSEGKTAALLSVEGAEILRCDLNKLKAAYELGIRALNLTWNKANELSGSCAEESGRGLSCKGKAFADECARLGIVIDVSHLSERGFWDVAERVGGPFIASHSNSSAVFGHRRNLTDRQFVEIMAHGGVAGINLYTDFLGGKSIDHAVRHILHFLELGGENSVAIGADFDGCSFLPEGIHGIENIHMLYNALVKAGVDNNIVNKIFFDNMIGVVERICDIRVQETKI